MKVLRDMRTINELLTKAEQQATSLGDTAPGAEHLVLAALLLEESSARDLLGVSADQFREAIVESHADALAAMGISTNDARLSPVSPPSGVYRSEESAQDVFQRARVLAKHGDGLKGAHIIQAAAERQHGTVARVLKKLGIDRESLMPTA